MLSRRRDCLGRAFSVAHAGRQTVAATTFAAHRTGEAAPRRIPFSNAHCKTVATFQTFSFAFRVFHAFFRFVTFSVSFPKTHQEPATSKT